jgi:Zn-dependent peptidase ImmA (M78 family)/transcriptional regulator with XRE-family HTH domain
VPTYAYVTPEVLRWARESAGYSVVDAAHKIGVRWSQLEAAEQGIDYLTLRQAEKAADVYERQLADLFLPEPPEEESQETKFRRLPGAPEPPWPAEMQLLSRRIRERQEIAKELYDRLEEEPPWTSAAERFRVADVEGLAPVARERLGVPFEEQEAWSDGFAALRAWIDAIEDLGILVMQDGSLPVDEMRGFASMDDLVPAIVVNNQDDPRARAFTLVHELGHHLLAANGVPVGPATEPWCNRFAGEVLMPPDRLEEVFGAARGQTLLRRIDHLARSFTVTPLAAAVRVARAGLVPRDEGEAVIAGIRTRREGEPPARGGGDYYWNQISRFGPAFIRLVFSALDTQAVTYPTASALLGNVKVNNFDTLRDYLDRRVQAA